ncbi:uncharacterized protein LOC113762102 isoform X1 [Coffea eugenioides]|uniref:uncharacterized protein LOC113762102 isoform X1 n=1 Tax=Coffea eugenioides TaxID=49369 RepID=UPI000F607D6F|nr:uncharacterized protein LOC113762102 isoform X1 [Coffea eugenioides]
MLGRRLLSLLKTRTPSTSSSSQASATASSLVEEESGRSSGKRWGRRAVSGALICLTGGVALSALDDLAIYHSCSSKAMEKASKSQAIIDAIGEPIVRGPWYNASLAVAHKRHSVSCTFPVSGPQGTGILQLKAVRNGDDSWFSFLRPRDWEILLMEALLHVPGNDEKQQTFRISVSDYLPPPPSPVPACKACTVSPQQPESLDKS